MEKVNSTLEAANELSPTYLQAVRHQFDKCLNVFSHGLAVAMGLNMRYLQEIALPSGSNNKAYLDTSIKKSRSQAKASTDDATNDNKKSKSPRVASVILLRKKDSAFCCCVYYRCLNAVTIRNAFFTI